MSFLPPEILFECFSKISKKDLFTCLFVCKAWYPFISRLYYTQVNLISNHATFLSMAQQPRLDGSFLGHSVRHLHFLYRDAQGRTTRTGDFTDTVSCNALTASQFHTLIQYLPDLVTIQFNAPCTFPSTHYLAYLRDIPRHHLRQLRDIRLPALSSSIAARTVSDDYFHNVRLSRATLTRVSLDVPVQDILVLLKQMPRLKELSLRYVDDAGDVLTACNCIETLDVTSPKVSLSTRLHGDLVHVRMAGMAMTDVLVETVVWCMPQLRHLKLELTTSLLAWLKSTNKSQVWAHKIRTLERLVWVTKRENASEDDVAAVRKRLWEFIGMLSSQQEVCLEVVFFRGVRCGPVAESLLLRQGVVTVKLAFEQGEEETTRWVEYVDFNRVSSIHVQSHVQDLHVDTFLGPLVRRLKKSGPLRIQCSSGSLQVDGSMTLHRRLITRYSLVGHNGLYPALEELVLTHWNHRASLLLDAFRYIRQIQIHLERSVDMVLRLVQPSGTPQTYRLHQQQIESCSDDEIAAAELEITLCPFHELVLFYENKVLHTFHPHQL